MANLRTILSCTRQARHFGVHFHLDFPHWRGGAWVWDLFFRLSNCHFRIHRTKISPNYKYTF